MLVSLSVKIKCGNEFFCWGSRFFECIFLNYNVKKNNCNKNLGFNQKFWGYTKLNKIFHKTNLNI